MMRTEVFLCSLISAVLVMAVPNGASAKQVYRWVDENGVVHYTDRAEGVPDAELVDIQKAPRINANALPSAAPTTDSADEAAQPSVAQQRRDARAEARQKAAEERQQMEATCAEARKRVASLEPSTHVMVEDEDGNVIRLDDNKRLELLNEAKDYANRNCNR